MSTHSNNSIQLKEMGTHSNTDSDFYSSSESSSFSSDSDSGAGGLGSGSAEMLGFNSDSETEKVGNKKRVARDRKVNKAVEEINVDFDFMEFTLQDYHGLKGLLNSGLFLSNFLGLPNGGSSIVDCVLNEGVGCVIKVDDNRDPFAFISCLDFFNLDLVPVELVKWVREGLSPQCWALLEASKSVGLILCDRLINMPPQVAPPLFSFLHQDLVEKKRGYEYYIHVVKLSKQVEKNRKRKRLDASIKETSEKVLENVQENYEYFQAEDEFIKEFHVDPPQVPLIRVVPNQQVAKSRRVFGGSGFLVYREIVVIKGTRFEEMVRVLENECV